MSSTYSSDASNFADEGAEVNIETRHPDPQALENLLAAGVNPLLARLFAARGVRGSEDLGSDLAQMIPPSRLKNIEAAAVLLADALRDGQHMVIIADYDCDGATACAVGVRGLRLLIDAVNVENTAQPIAQKSAQRAQRAQVDYLVPNRFEYGYGLTPEIVRLAVERFHPDLIITVDNGIASIEGVDEATLLGVKVLVTDHHLPGDSLPEAACIVNPNQPGCTFPSKNLAGVGVMFYVLLALRAELRQRGLLNPAAQPRLDSLLDLVALGTVADVVRLDSNNRLLVAQGLKRMQAGRMQPGVMALFQAAGREARSASAFDLGFALGPRLNAAGRLADMALGIECLTTDDTARALEIATQLDGINRERRNIEAEMQEGALALLEEMNRKLDGTSQSFEDCATLCLFDPSWHHGVVGILASRIKDRFHRPTIAFAPASDGDGDTVRGSGRSIPGLHLRDAIDLVSKRSPGLILKFGGHAMAAGLTVHADRLGEFIADFEDTVAELLDPALLTRTLETDGPLPDEAANILTVQTLNAQVWGQGFAAPLFCDEFAVLNQRLLKEKHLKLLLRKRRTTSKSNVAPVEFDAIWFNHSDSLPERVRVVYRLEENRYNGAARVQLLVEHAEAI